MTKSLLFFLLANVLITTACSDRLAEPKTVKQNPSDPTKAHRHGEFNRDLGRFENEGKSRQDIHVKSYALKGAFNWERKELAATLEMAFGLLCSCTESIVLDSKVEEIQSIVLKNTGQSLPYSLSTKNDLSIDLSQVPEALRKREMTIVIQYRSKANLRGDGEPSSLTLSNGVAGDPVKSKVVYTYAEPLDASHWMPCVNDPAYRAKFSAEFKMPVDQMFIANGDLTRNEIVGDSRWVKYETKYTLPTYLMAFAQGDFTIATEYHGALPVSVVARRGIRADVHGLLKETIRQIKHFESLLVPFPFEKYMLVLLPEFVAGGIEHAGITFVDETSNSQSKLSRDVGLMAHELGHQWFGDLVTVRSWDDLWIKEGMASLLGEEAMRPYEDPSSSGRLMGHDFAVSNGEAIVDLDLKPEDKYTDGPYGRAAWLLTQFRSILGEEAFWGTLRKVLNDYRFQSISTEEFLRYFNIEKAKKAVVAKALPEFKVVKENGVFKLTLEDKEGALLTPVQLSWYSDAGGIETEVLSETTKLEHLTNDVRLLTLDKRDIHPLEAFQGWEVLEEILNPMMAPRREAQLSYFLSLPGHVHQRALGEEVSWAVNPKNLISTYKKLNSEYAKYGFLNLACEMARKAAEPSMAEAWRGEISNVFLAPPMMGMQVRGTKELLSECEGIVRKDLFTGLWASIEMNPSSEDRSEMDYYYASLVPMETQEATFKVWSKVAKLGSTLRTRIIGLQNILRNMKEVEKSVVEKKFLAELVEESRTMKFLQYLLPAVKQLKIAEAAPSLAKILRSETYPAWRNAYCTAVAIVKDNAEAKKAFETALGDVSTLPKSIQGMMKDPKSCGE